ncbi:MAG: hypothetical protein IM613_20235, partial [Cytophagales bacterium]|nr:hypothetical protein [Cytophagales bacterium]
MGAKSVVTPTIGEKIARLVVKDPGREADVSYMIDQWIDDFKTLPRPLLMQMFFGVVSVPFWAARFGLLFKGSFNWASFVELLLITNSCAAVFI